MSLLSPSVLTWLRAFEAAARHNSFSLAAMELHVTQGAISQHVKSLEEWLGVRLFERQTRQLKLLPAGLRLKQTTKEAFQTLEQTLSSIRPGAQRSVLNLNCSPSFAMQWIMPRIGHALREHPELSLRVHGEFHALNHDRMHIEHIDAAIRFDIGDYDDVYAMPFLDEWLIPVATPAFMTEHPDIRGAPDIPAELMLHDEFAWAGAPAAEEWHHWLAHTGAARTTLQGGRYFNLSLLAQNAALSGQGIAMARTTLVMEDLLSKRLIPVTRLAVQSKASYQFVCLDPKDWRVRFVQDWLKQESLRFRRQRTTWLRQKKFRLLTID